MTKKDAEKMRQALREIKRLCVFEHEKIERAWCVNCPANGGTDGTFGFLCRYGKDSSCTPNEWRMDLEGDVEGKYSRLVEDWRQKVVKRV